MISTAWSVYDLKDSIVVRAVVDPGDMPSKALLIASVQILAGRTVWTDKSHETADPEGTEKRAAWLPASLAVEILLSKGRPGPNGSVILDLGVIRPVRLLTRLHAFDPDLQVVALRATARLIGARVTPERAVMSRQIDLATGD